MAKFMKDIVHEVLNRNKPQTTASPSSPAPPPGPAPQSQPQIPGIHRPNYQREKRQERLRPIAAPQEERLSALQRLTTAQAIDRLQPQSSASLKGRQGEGAQLIGKTRKNQYVWLFPCSNPKIPSVAYGDSTGMITGASTNPGTFFLIDQATRGLSDISCGTLGDKRQNGLPDVIKLHSKDLLTTQQILKDLFNQLNRTSVRSIETYISEHPSRFLLECLNQSNGVSIGMLDGVSYVNGMALLDRYFKLFPETPFQFDLRENCLFLSGPMGVVESVLEKLEKDALRLLT
ncbi:hypothetical protein [Ammoniphilus sp. 3BR4]|uniref:hypothetical protein n=1 Tax=Ammoniphilus sp. 3BR4 TaxID=3158265 RepID=UPI003467668E